LIRDYLAGQGAFADDPPEELAQRLVDGAYVAQIHQRIKQYITQYTRETRRTYQWPRRHSFHARITDLLMLGLLVETGEAAPEKVEPQHRGAGRLGSASRVDADGVLKRGFSRRVWVRLAPDAFTRPEWADPLGYLIILKQSQDPSSYQNIRTPGQVLAAVAPVSLPLVSVVEPVIPVVPPAVSRVERALSVIAPRRRAPARDVPLVESAERLAALEAQRQALHASAEFMSVNGDSAAAFERLWRTVREFHTAVTRVYGQTPFHDLAEALGTLQNCAAGLVAERQMTQQRVQAVNF
jgi:hypothetical protein